MAAYTQWTVTTITEEHPARNYDDVCTVTVGDESVIFTVTVPPGGAA